MTLESRIELIADKAEHWFNDESTSLIDAATRTYNEGFFPKSDVLYAIRCLKDSVSKESLSAWATEAGVSKNISEDQKVLCLHAGNLPLVGFQDVLAALLSGYDYYGKISRKDPYLLPDFLDQFKGTPLESHIHWDTDLQGFTDLKANALTFSGSESSIPEVMEVVKGGNMADNNCRYLIRKAHFSIAYLDDFNPENSENLVNALLRYDGKGCRSVAIVVSPLKLGKISCTFTDYFESYWMNNPTHRKPSPGIKYRFAYNKAVQKVQMLLEHLIIEENNDPVPANDDIIYWVHGGLDKMAELSDRFGDQVQNLYVCSDKLRIPGYREKTELLSRAQCPLINWKPDGIDIFKWLMQ
jgi:hypothetical protein